MKELITVFLCITAAYCLKLKNVERAIDLGSQLARISSTLTIENDGSSHLEKFLFYIEAKQASHLAFIGTSTGLNVKPTTSSSTPIGAKTFEVTLKDPIKPGKSAKVKVETVFAESIVPFPKEITQREKHLVKYTGNLYFYSEYPVISQTTKISVPPGTTEGFTKIKPVTYSDNIINYGPYENIKSFTEEELFVHYENSKTFLTVTSLLRTIELSHWGNIAIEETVDISHTGAKLKGSFSRFDFQREGASANAVKKFKTVLPAAAKDIYYRDHIGNISTSNVRVLKESVEAELRPRFPLFGGWKTHYVLGYNVPSYEYLYRNGDFYTLKLRLLDHVFDNVFVKNLEIRVILPEGVTDIEVSTPYDVKRLQDRLHYTFLDIGGRPVITFLAQNLVDEHIQDFKVEYRFNRIFMLREVVMCIVAFFLLYLSVVIYSYLDFSLNKDETTVERMKVAGLIEDVKNRHEKRESLYKQWNDLINKLKQNKDASSFQNSLKPLITEAKDQNKLITEVASKLKSLNSSLAEKVNELQKHESLLREILTSRSTNAERVVQGKLPKSQYVNLEESLEAKQAVEMGKINSLIRNLGY